MSRQIFSSFGIFRCAAAGRYYPRVASKQHIGDIEPRQHEARQEGRGKQIADRHVRRQAIDDQNDGWWHHSTQRPASTDNPDGQVLVISLTQHLWQCQQAQQHDLAADDAAHGGQNDGDKIVWTATPPLSRPPNRRMASNRSLAMPDRSRIAAIITNIGTETKTKDDTNE